jgi:hypothetical protein
MEGVQAFDILQTPLLVYELLNNVEELPFSGAMYTELKSEYMFFFELGLYSPNPTWDFPQQGSVLVPGFEPRPVGSHWKRF